MAIKKKAKPAKHIIKHAHKEHYKLHTKTHHEYSKHKNYSLSHTGSIQHHDQSKLENLLQRVPIYPIIVGALGVLFLIVFLAASIKVPIGYAVKDSIDDSPNCLKEGRDGFNYKVLDKGECCFLISNTDRCIGPLDNTAAEYKSAYSGKVEGVFHHSYACYGGSTKKVLFSTTVKNYCDLQI